MSSPKTGPSLPPPLSKDFFIRDTLIVAQDLLGQELIRRCPEDGDFKRFRIVETEAYTEADPACHAYQRTTGRAAILYGEPGLAYVYFIYGMHYCLNVVTEPQGQGGAVLFRALEPLQEENRYATHGPGRLTKSLAITKARFNESDLTDASQPLYLAEGKGAPSEKIIQTTRIGIQKAADWPWRFYIENNPWVSVTEKKTSKNSKKRRKP